MQITIISDIQGNAFALEHVLRQARRAGTGRVLCLGDLASGPEPVAVLDLLRAYDVTCVRGNMDEVLVDPPAYSGSDADERKYAEIDRWGHEQLSAAHRDHLRTLPLTVSFEAGMLSGLCFHGSPGSTEDVIDSTTPAERLDELLKDTNETILITGHMHLPMLRAFGDRVILNPGSVGLSYGGKRLMPTRAEYAVLSVTGSDFAITFHQTDYDPGAFKRRLLVSGMPHAEWYASKWRD